MAADQALQAWHPSGAEWRAVASLDTVAVSRLAVSPSAEWLALVDGQ
jgi:hypothetical protein